MEYRRYSTVHETAFHASQPKTAISYYTLCTELLPEVHLHGNNKLILVRLGSSFS